jgi:hypothetical protein
VPNCGDIRSIPNVARKSSDVKAHAQKWQHEGERERERERDVYFFGETVSGSATIFHDMLLLRRRFHMHDYLDAACVQNNKDGINRRRQQFSNLMQVQ